MASVRERGKAAKQELRTAHLSPSKKCEELAIKMKASEVGH